MKKHFAIALIPVMVFSVLSCSGKPQTSADDLVIHLTFDEISGDGTLITDTSGNGNDGMINGQKTVDGIVGGALSFDGYGQTVKFDDVKMNAPATIAFHINTNDMFHDRRLFSQTEGPETLAGSLRIDGTQIEVWDGSSWQVLIDRRVRINEWMHIAVTYGADGKTIGYLNGERQHLVPCTFDFSGAPAGIGAGFPGKSGNGYIGLMDDFRLYRRILGEDEVLSLAEAEQRVGLSRMEKR